MLNRNVVLCLQKIQIWLKSQKGPIEVYLCPEDGPNTGTNLSQQAAVATAGKLFIHNGSTELAV